MYYYLLFSATVAQWVGGGRLIESLTGLSYTTALFYLLFCTCVRINWWISCVALSDTLLGIIMLVGTTIILIATVIAGGGIEKIAGTCSN